MTFTTTSAARTPIDKGDIARRAMAAYFRSVAKAGGAQTQPRPAKVIEVGGLHYVALSNVNGVLAVYRVRTDGALKRLVRWPAELGERW